VILFRKNWPSWNHIMPGIKSENFNNVCSRIVQQIRFSLLSTFVFLHYVVLP